MPNYNIRKWPRTNEQPPGLYKPWFDYGQWVGLWSPVAQIICFITGISEDGPHAYFGVGLAEAVRIDSQRFRYESLVTADGSWVTVEPRYDMGSPTPSGAWNPIVRYQPPPASGIPGLLDLTLLTVTRHVGDPDGRNREINWASFINNSPECWKGVGGLQVQLRPVDPNDNDLPELDRFWKFCPP